MFDKFRLKDVLAQYKQDFISTQWNNEKYKWEAVKWFRDNWDVNAPDFPGMLNRSLDKTLNLLASNNNFPKGMIVDFAKAAPEEVRAMFIDLFDENNDVFERMETSVYKGYKRDKIEMRGDRAEISDFPLYLNTVAGGLDRRDQTIGGFSFVVKIYALPVVEIIG